MVIYSLYIINKYGGLIYQQDFQITGQAKLSMNNHLMIGSTFHGIHAITRQLAPVQGSGGIEVLETDTFKLQCFQATTGTKFYMVAEPNQSDLDSILQKIYNLYADYVLKNPFYELEQPIRCEQFDIELTKLIASPDRY